MDALCASYDDNREVLYLYGITSEYVFEKLEPKAHAENLSRKEEYGKQCRFCFRYTRDFEVENCPFCSRRLTLSGELGIITITITGKHLFYVNGKGWCAAAELETGNVLRTQDGERIMDFIIRKLDKLINVSEKNTLEMQTLLKDILSVYQISLAFVNFTV